MFAPNDIKDCQLCGLSLGDICNHPGQANNNPTYLITELNPFKIVDVKVRFCSARNCLAMHQASVEKLGKYMFEKNTSKCGYSELNFIKKNRLCNHKG